MRLGLTSLPLLLGVVCYASWRLLRVPSAEENEAATISRLRRYVKAQSACRREDHYGKGDLLGPYPFANTDDGEGLPDLYQLGGPGYGGKVLGLIEEEFARATGPKHAVDGYYFVDLAYDDYTIDFGLCAVPQEYPRSGVHTFIVDVTGTVYQRDNGGKPVNRYPTAREFVPWLPPCTCGDPSPRR